MQCVMKKEDKSLARCRKCLNYLFRQMCFIRRIGLLFATILSYPSQSHSAQPTPPSSLVCSLFYPHSCQPVAYPELVSGGFPKVAN